MVDVEKLDKALARIERRPEEWQQGSWGYKAPSCGTRGCLAFHVGMVDGAPIAWDEPYDDGEEPVTEVMLIAGEPPWVYARQALGLNDDQASALFTGTNTMRDLRAMRDVLAANPDATRVELYAATPS